MTANRGGLKVLSDIVGSLFSFEMSADDPKRTCDRQTFIRRILKARLVNIVEHEHGDDKIDYEN